jgi:hypothetical protein
MIKVFLGGTCNNSSWRNSLIPKLDKSKVEYMDPVVPDWTPEYQVKEEQYKKTSDYNLYVITPKIKGVFSIAEATHDACKNPQKTVFCILTSDEFDYFDKPMTKSLQATSDLIKNCGANVFESLDDVANFLNKR